MFNFSLHNYRSFQNQKLNFSRINILIGENSGGKSSLLKILLALKQTLDSPTEVNLKLTGDFTDLGNFEEAVYYRKKNRKIKIGFEFGENYLDFFLEALEIIDSPSKAKLTEIKDILNEYINSPSYVSYEFSPKLNDHSSIKTIFTNKSLGTLEIIQKKAKIETNTRPLLCDLKFDFLRASGTIEDCTAYKDGFLTLFDNELKPKCNTTESTSKNDYIFYSIVFFLVCQNYIQAEFKKVKFVNPIGTSPKRFYFQEDTKNSYRLIDIEKFINVLSDKKLSQKQYQDRIELLNKTIKSFGIADEVSVIKDKQLPVLALNVKTKDFWTNITDVGYGVSLQIPILFQALLSENYTKKGETLLIEQPEVHLHPMLQAKFIETLLSIGSKNTYFIETHSEHIIRKLQVLVKEKKYGLKSEDITIHYFKREPQKFNISEHKIQVNGKLTPAFPTGFYDTSYSLVKQLL